MNDILIDRALDKLIESIATNDQNKPDIGEIKMYRTYCQQDCQQEELDKIQGLKISKAVTVVYWEEYISVIHLHFDDGLAVRICPVCSAWEKNISADNRIGETTGHVQVEALADFCGKTIALATQHFSDRDGSGWLEVVFDDRTTLVLTPEDDGDTNQNGDNILIELAEAPVLDELGHEVRA